MNKDEVLKAFAAEVMNLPDEDYRKTFELEPWHRIGQIVELCVRKGWKVVVAWQPDAVRINVGEVSVNSLSEFDLSLAHLFALAAVKQTRWLKTSGKTIR